MKQIEINKPINHVEEFDENKKRCIIAGWSRMAKQVCDNLLDNLSNEYNVIGFINVFQLPGEQINSYRNIPLLSSFEKLSYNIDKIDYNHIIIALDPHEYAKIHKIIAYCNTNDITYELINDNYDVIYGNSIKYIAIDTLANWDFSIVRLFELIFAFSLTLLFLPLFIMVAIMVKLDSTGAIMYSQERVGKDGRIFRIFKFRTMVQNAEKLSGPQLATKRDPRITKSGRFMRKTRLDEIPQLINILVGDMSFIGPRPERPFFVDKYSRQIPFYKNRLKVKPGVTGIAQIKVGYDETIDDVMDKVKWDLHYIEHKSIFLDIKILLKTIIVLLSAQGQ
ncbi:MAG: sugar transferase [Calditrichia bacterium]|nr:sugar transferase [Calditrichia bacterium]